MSWELVQMSVGSSGASPDGVMSWEDSEIRWECPANLDTAEVEDITEEGGLRH